MRIPDWLQQSIYIAHLIQEVAIDQYGDVELLSKFPRDIERFVILGLEIPVIRVPSLSLETASNYLCVLSGDKITIPHPTDNRLLYGLLHVGPPTTTIFIKADLPRHLINYVLAHEIGHFVADVLMVRNLWVRALPEMKTAVHQAFAWQGLDQLLELSAAINCLPARPSTITARGGYASDDMPLREQRADWIGRELIAPWETAVSVCASTNRRKAIDTLRTDFGLPYRVANSYYDDIELSREDRPDFVDLLFKPLIDKKRQDKSEH